MSQKNSILVGIDYSSHCQNALLEAARIANSHGVPLICYHVLDGDLLDDFRKMEAFSEEGVLGFSQKKMDALIGEVIGTAHGLESVVKIGHPFEETLNLIEEYKVKTLVLGSHGFSSDKEKHIGALASRCIRQAPVEVLLVRGFQNEPFRKVVACVDFSDTSNRAVCRAAEICQQDQAHLRLVHVYRPPIFTDPEMGMFGPSYPIISDESIKESFEAKLEDLAEQVREEYQLNEISTLNLVSQSIHHGIAEELKECNADLVVLGTRGRTGFKKLLLGTTAEGLINNTPCSALTIKASDFHFSLH